VFHLRLPVECVRSGSCAKPLPRTLSRVVLGRDVVIAGAADKISDGRLIDDAALRFAPMRPGCCSTKIRGRHAFVPRKRPEGSVHYRFAARTADQNTRTTIEWRK